MSSATEIGYEARACHLRVSPCRGTLFIDLVGDPFPFLWSQGPVENPLHWHMPMNRPSDSRLVNGIPSERMWRDGI